MVKDRLNGSLNIKVQGIIGYNVYIFTTNTHKLSNMILEIKPYHVDIIMKQMK